MSECCVGVGVCCVCLEESDSPRHSLPSLGLSLQLVRWRSGVPPNTRFRRLLHPVCGVGAEVWGEGMMHATLGYTWCIQ